MKKSSFIYQFITNPRRVGAIWPSSNFLGNKMVEGINFQDAKYIVEFGPGTGAFTEKILERRRSNTTIVLIESNKEFWFRVSFTAERKKVKFSAILLQFN